MVVKRSKTSTALADTGYFDLIARFPLKPLATEKAREAAQAIIDELVDRGFDDLSEGEEAYLDVLSDLMKKYEDQHYTIPDASPVEILKFFIDDRKTNQRVVALGSGIQTSTMSEILAGNRKMNLDHMRKLAGFFKVPVGIFLPASTPAVEADYTPATSRKRSAQPKRGAAAKK
jgi:HTH-type transcriptional regulator / antitoxin HigA